MKRFLLLLIIIFSSVGIISFFLIIFNEAYFNTSYTIDTELAYKFGSFFGGYVGTLFSIVSVTLLIYSIFNQNVENRKNEIRNHFFKMLDYHNENVKQIKISHIDRRKTYKIEGRRAFVIFKMQIKYLLEFVKEINEEYNFELDDSEVIDIAYTVFYYGLSTEWIPFIQEKLQKYPFCDYLIIGLFEKFDENEHFRLGRTNQTSLSTYFRNMYNAIKLVEYNKYLLPDEKMGLIKIYRAQLSNPELYVLFFNISSTFGEKWKKEKFITKYSFIKNIPFGYCDGYEPRDTFPMNYEGQDD